MNAALIIYHDWTVHKNMCYDTICTTVALQEIQKDVQLSQTAKQPQESSFPISERAVNNGYRVSTVH